ncbi:hypothetical protein ACOSQ4_021946 [Xanthoceras sorbifolium]
MVRNILLVVLTLLTCTFNTEKNLVAALFQSQTVIVRNSLGAGSVMRIHCKSGDEDLGEYYLGFNAAFEWSFRVLWRTMYWCNLYWDNNRYQKIHAFDVDRRDDEFCKPICVWKIKQDGAYCMRDDPNNQDFRHIITSYMHGKKKKIRYTIK